ncbi:hypothetical protein MTO96_048994 [Rhipicephalus appendiculatus]
METSPAAEAQSARNKGRRDPTISETRQIAATYNCSFSGAKGLWEDVGRRGARTADFETTLSNLVHRHRRSLAAGSAVT